MDVNRGLDMCDCACTLLEVYVDLEADHNAFEFSSLDALLSSFDQTRLGAVKSMDCPECSHSTFNLAVVCCLLDCLATAAWSQCQSMRSDSATSNNIDKRSSLGSVDEYALQEPEARFLAACLLHSRVQELRGDVLLPTKRIVGEISVDPPNAQKAQTLAACQRSLEETVETLKSLTSLLQMRWGIDGGDCGRERRKSLSAGG